VPAEREVHSLHAYFIRAGDPKIPIVYQVERIRDGRSFSTRRALAIQHGQAIFALSGSFQLPQEGLEHADPMPAGIPDPESLPDIGQLVEESRTDSTLWAKVPRPIDLRYVSGPGWPARRTGLIDGPIQVWMRADGTLPDEKLLHVCMLTYASDLTLLNSVLARHDIDVPDERIQRASLDHAMWFHRPFRADEWLLYECYSPTASGSRGLAQGRFFSRDGRLVATAVQEGLVRISSRA
jgi:acyl-CoA thioesterase-2